MKLKIEDRIKGHNRPKRRTTKRLVVHRFSVEPMTPEGMHNFFTGTPEGVATVTLSMPYREKKRIFKRWEKTKIPDHLVEASYVPYHFSIDGETGAICQHLPVDARGAHAAMANHDSIGIAVLRDMRKEKPSAAAITALVDLCYMLNLARAEEKPYTIWGHDELRKYLSMNPKGCPGDLMDLDAVRRNYDLLRKYTNKDNLV